MKYFELEETRLSNLLKMEKLWGVEKKEGEPKVRSCTICLFSNTLRAGNYLKKIRKNELNSVIFVCIFFQSVIYLILYRVFTCHFILLELRVKVEG